MSVISGFPALKTITIDMAAELQPLCAALPDGISEFCFPNLFLDAEKYGFQIARIAPSSFIVCGRECARSVDGVTLPESYFSIIGELPSKEIISALLKQYRYWKNMPESFGTLLPRLLPKQSFRIIEDRDNFDYIYRRNDLALLQGKALHKKKNLVNAFIAAHSGEIKQLDVYSLPDALTVLESWKTSRPEDQSGDYRQCRKALDLMQELKLSGIVVYADGVPVGFSAGTFLRKDTVFVVLFEKGINSYKGVYQFVNRAQALNLPAGVEFINREQDLGDSGLRQAKMTYRPCDFIKKYLVVPV